MKSSEFPSVFKYTSCTNFLKDVYLYELNQDPELTLKKLANKYGYKSHGTIQHILSGARLPSESFIETLSNYYSMPKRDKIFLQKLLEIEQTPSLLQNEEYIKELKTLTPFHLFIVIQTV